MKSFTRILLCLSLLWVTENVSAAGQLSDKILQTDIVSPEANAGGDLLVLVSIKSADNSKILDAPFLTQLILHRLKALGISAQKYRGNFETDFEKNAVPGSLVLSPKIAVDINVERNATGGTYRLTCALNYIRYEKDGDHNFIPRQMWNRRQDILSLPEADAEETLGQYVQKQIQELAAQIVKEPVGRSNQKSATSRYSLNWHDPDRLRNHLLLGVAFGTPAIGNLYVGFWGSKDVPIVIGASGMYYGNTQRGLQLDAGWAFDNAGDFRQIAGIAAAFFYETSSSTSVTSTDVLGRPLTSNVNSNSDMVPYLGPTYTAYWDNFKFQTGIAFPVTPNAQSSFRFLIQLGYSLPIGF